jgi:hypothetical protein
MSKHETPITRWYWHKVIGRQGLLIEEFPAVKRDGAKGKKKRHIDGVIVLGQKAELRGPRKRDCELVRDKRVIVIQSKARRLGMSLIGQVVVSPFAAVVARQAQPGIKSPTLHADPGSSIHRLV